MRCLLAFYLAAALVAAGPGVRRGKGPDVWEGVIPSIRTFGLQDGPPNMTVYTVTEDRAGRLWVGTQDGSALYNGRTWTTLPLPKESASQFIRALAETPDGARWFGTEGAGLWRLQGEQWTHFAAGAGFPSNTVNFLTVVQEEEGGPWTLWAATAGGGVARFDGAAWTPMDTRNGLPANVVWKVRELPTAQGLRELWAVTTRGVGKLVEGRWTALGAAQGWPEGEANDLAQIIHPDGRREFLLSIWGKGLYRGVPGAWTLFCPEAGNFPSAYPVLCIVRPDAGGHPVIWVSTYDRGVSWNADGKWRHLDAHTGLPADGVYFLHAPKAGRPTVWLGMRGGGLAGLDLGGWYLASTQTGLPANEVHAFAETTGQDGGSIHWIGTSEGLARWEGGRWQVDTTREGLPSSHVTSLLAVPRAAGPELWAGTMRGLARRRANGRWETLFHTAGLKDQRILCLQDTDQGRVVWAGTEKGLLRIAPEGNQFLTVEQGLPDARVFSLARTLDPDGGESLWVGTRGGGIGRLKSGQWTHFREAQGLKNLSVFCFRETRSRDGRRWLWAGTFGGGILRLPLDTPSATRWDTFTVDNLPGFPSNVVVRMEVDAAGQLYLATQRGVARLAFKDPLIPQRPSRVDTFTTGDGVAQVACNYGASMLDGAGRVWVATHRGAAVLDPLREQAVPPLPNLALQQATVRGRSVTLGPKGLVLGHKDNELTFEVSLPTFYREEDVRYRSQLRGLEDHPTPWTATPRREMASLPPGHYTLHLEAMDHLGRTATPLDYPLTVRPAPWRSWWAYTAYTLALGVGVLAFTRLRLRYLAERNAALEASIREATRELQGKNRALEDLNEEKNQFMGIAAHDLKNPLNAVILAAQQIAMGDMEPDELNHYARMIERASRQMAELIKNMLDVNRMDTGQMQLNIQPLDLSGMVADVCAEYSPRAQAKLLRVLAAPGRDVAALGDPLHLRDVLENFISNAIKFTPPGPPTRDVVVRAYLEEGRAILEVQDQGPGFTDKDKAKVFGRFERLSAKPTAGEGSTGLGLSIVKRLVEAMGGTVALESEAGRGATFRVSLPTPPSERGRG